MWRRAAGWTAVVLMLLPGSMALGRGTYQEPVDFISETFAASPPPARLLWLTAGMESEAGKILGHTYGQRRVRYWLAGERSAWVLDEIGKEEPITTGIVIHAGRIERVKVLVYRESRGGEVRHERFTRQYAQATLQPGHRLDRHIDGFSGATLSVEALTRLARLALYLDSKARESP